MNVAVYTDNAFEQQQISDTLKKCGVEYLRPVRVTLFTDYTAFCHDLDLRRFDLLVIAQGGTFSLELMDAVRQRSPDTPVFWFSDLDFAVRSYEYGVIWFGKKPVELSVMRRAFQRLQDRKRRNPVCFIIND